MAHWQSDCTAPSHMRRSLLLLIASALTAAACNKSTPSAPTPVATSPTTPTTPTTPTPTPTPTALLPVLTLQQDTGSPVGQAVALTYASRAQEAGKIAIAVTGFNIQNQITPTVFGFSTAEGRLKWDASLLEIDGEGAGDLLGGNSAAGACAPRNPQVPDTFAFCIGRLDQTRVTGSGEIYLFRLKPRSGVTSGTSRVELVPFLANSGGTGVPSIVTFVTPLWLFPYVPGERGNVIQNSYGATVTISPGN